MIAARVSDMHGSHPGGGVPREPLAPFFCVLFAGLRNHHRRGERISRPLADLSRDSVTTTSHHP